MKKLIASILAAGMTLALISCGETAPEIDDTPEKTTESMSESVTETERLKPDIPESDFSEYQFTVLARGSNAGDWANYDIESDGINGDISILLTKSLLDLIIIVIMTASMGIGCIFSALPVFVFQGSITLLSKLLEPLMTDQATWALSLVGTALIFCVGINLAFDRKIKVGNLLPSLVFAVAFSFIPALV